MIDRTKTMEREPGSTPSIYEVQFKARKEVADRQNTGKLLIKSNERHWETARQGRLKFYMSPWVWPEVALRDWAVFMQEVVQQSGKHRHQGGIVIFVLEGHGYSVCDGVRMDWKKGDLILLPIQPNGVEHQHFNLEPGNPCRWLAFVHMPLHESISGLIEQVELSPLFTGSNK